MTSPTLELQSAVIAALKSYAPLTAIVGQRIYDAVPTNATFPYVSLGPTDELPADAECINATDITFQIDGWSRATGAPEVIKIAWEIRQALRQPMTLTDNAFVLLEHQSTRRLRDPDGLTNHAVVSLTATIEEPATTP